ncbi:predicted DNA-binding transcriptional regulator [Cronobacter sakazakii 701]|nr:predicted DNA-binding transcriptional regulator [Cronobacter sakazakii 701]
MGSPATQLSFYRLVQAITTCQRVTLLTDGNRCERLAPYRLIAQQSHWYLVAEHHDRPVVFSLSDIHLVQPLTESFKRNERFYRLTEDLSFIRALPHFQFIQQAITNITTT